MFPSVESMIRLVGAVMAELDEDWSGRCAIASMDLLERESRIRAGGRPGHGGEGREACARGCGIGRPGGKAGVAVV